MDAVLLRYYPHNVNKIFQQKFDNVKLKAGTYVYSQNDRVKKLCSILDKTIDVIKIIELSVFFENAFFFIKKSIFMIYFK